MTDLPLAALLRRDKFIVLGSMSGIVLLSWVYLVWMAKAMSSMSVPTVMPEWTTGYFLMMLSMWVIMMIGMMLPSVTPVVLIFARVSMGSQTPYRPILRTYLFALGYLLAWALFSIAATALQWGLDSTLLLSSQMQTLSPFLGAGILLMAGIYQWTPIKNACLEHCRGPVDYLSTHWRTSLSGALRMGLEHGLFCIGCCWVLMTLLFVGGVMNLLVVALITVFVLIEKISPKGDVIGRWSGSVLIIFAVIWISWALNQ